MIGTPGVFSDAPVAVGITVNHHPAILDGCSAGHGCVGRMVQVAFEGPFADDDEFLYWLIPVCFVSLKITVGPGPHGRSYKRCKKGMRR
jgi:hypothetical protein